MKTMILILFLFPVLGFTQDFDPNTMPYDSAKNDIIYTEIFDCDTFNKKQIYDAALISITEIFNSANDVIQYKDENTGKIIVKARFNVHYKILGETREGGYMTYTATVSIKDKKAKIEISQLTHYGANTQGNLIGNGGPIINFYKKPVKRPWQQITEEADTYCRNLITRLKNTITINLKKTTDSDW